MANVVMTAYRETLELLSHINDGMFRRSDVEDSITVTLGATKPEVLDRHVKILIRLDYIRQARLPSVGFNSIWEIGDAGRRILKGGPP